MEEIKLNSNHTNALIKANILSDKEMRKIGFTDYNPDVWFYVNSYPEDDCFEFVITIPKDGSDIEIVTLDSNFCQPYDYQAILHDYPDNSFARGFREFVEEEMAYLESKGVLSGHIKYKYI